MKNNCIEASKTKSILNKKNSVLNFKQALSKRQSKNSNIVSKADKTKPLKVNNKLSSIKSKELSKNQIKPFLTKNEIRKNLKHNKNSEKIKNLLMTVNKNSMTNSNSNFHKNNYCKNKSTTNLCAPTPVSGQKSFVKAKNNKNLDSNKSPKINELIPQDNNNEINQEFENNQKILKTNLAFLIAKNQNYDDDSVFFNINESYLEYLNNKQNMEIKNRNNNSDKNKNEYLSEEISIKNNNTDNNESSTLINSIININKFLTNEVNHKAINDTNSKNDNKRTKPKKVYENQLAKTPYSKNLNKTKEEFKNNENDKNITNIINNQDNVNSNYNLNDNYQKELINKVIKSKLSGTGGKPLKTKLMKKKKFLNLVDFDEDNNVINQILYYNTHSPKITLDNNIIKNFQFSPKVSSINKTLFNIQTSIKNDKKENNLNERIKVSKAKKYQVNDENLNKKSGINKTKEEKKENSIKSNKNYSFSSKKTSSIKSNSNNNNKINININNNNFNKINEFSIFNENVNNIITNNINSNLENKIKNNSLNYNIFDDEFYNNKLEFKNKKINNNNNRSQFDKYLTYIDNFSTKKYHKKKNNNNCSCHFIHPTLKNNNKYNTLVNQEKNKINISNIEQNNEYLNTQEDENNSKIQEIKIRLKNSSNLNYSVDVDNKSAVKINNKPNINIVNFQNSTINISKNKYKIINTNANTNESYYRKNFKENKKGNKSISSIQSNKKKSLILNSKSPSYRMHTNSKNIYQNVDDNYLNNSNDKIMNQQVFIKKIFNNNFKYKTQNNFLKLEKKNKINNIQQLLNIESNANKYDKKSNIKSNLNIKMIPSINNLYTSKDMEYSNKDINNNIIYNMSNNNFYENKKIFEKKNFNTSHNFFNSNINKSHNNIKINKNKNSTSKIYVKPSKCSIKTNLNYNTNQEYSSPHKKNFCSQEDEMAPVITSYRNNNNLNDKQTIDNDLEFINNSRTSEKVKKSFNIYDLNKVNPKAYIKKNNNINYNKKNNNKQQIKKKVCIINNDRITKYYSYFMKRVEIFKNPCYISKFRKKPKILPICKRSFMTKAIYKYIKRIKNEICYIDKKIIKNSKNILKKKEINDLNEEENIIKANILDFSLEQNNIMADYSYNNQKAKNNFNNNFNNDKDYQEIVGDINLSFSLDEVNTFKNKESTIEAVFNELNNLNSIDSEIKITFGQENVSNNYHSINNNNCNNLETSTEGRIIKDQHQLNNVKIRKKKIPKYIPKNYKKKKILDNNNNKDNISSSVIIHDNKEQNEDILINFDFDKENIDNNDNDKKYQTEKDTNNIQYLEKIKENKLIIDTDRLIQKTKKEITPKDVINFAEKLENIFDKKKSNSNEYKNGIFKDINIYCSNFNIYDNKIINLNNDDFIKEIKQKCKTYSPDINKYLEILRYNDLTPLKKLEKRMNTETNDFKRNSKDRKNFLINEIDSENENNVTFSQNKTPIDKENDIKLNNIFFGKEINYLLNIVSIKTFNNILNQLSEIFFNKGNINEQNNIMNNFSFFVDNIIRRSIYEKKNSFLYALLLENIYSILTHEKNLINSNEDIFKNYIDFSLKKKLKSLDINNSNYNEFSVNIYGITNLVIDLIYIKIIEIEKGFYYINILYDNYLKISIDKMRNVILKQILFFIEKLGKIVCMRNEIKYIDHINNFINEKIKILISNDKIKRDLNDKLIINKIQNLTNENLWNLSIYEEYKLNLYKKINILNENYLNNDKNNDENDENNKIDKIENNNYLCLNNDEYEVLLIIKYSIFNYNIDDEKNNDIYNELKSNKNIEIYMIIRYYLEICIDYVDKESLVDKCNNYINNIIENYSNKNNKNEETNNKIIDLILNIDNIIIDNKNMYQIMGYLLYSLINYELYKIEDLDKFIGKDEQTLINISIVIKYIIIYCNNDFEDSKIQISEEFRDIELFKQNSKLFDTYVISDNIL